MKQSTLFLFIALTTILFSCSKVDERILIPNLNVTQNDADKIEASKFVNRNIFGVALAKAIGHSKQLNTLIKNMADDRFDGTYDILYSELMNQTIEGLKANDYIKQFADNQTLFQKAIDESPLLTIYIPELPSGWNIDTWKPETESPNVIIAKNLMDDKRVMNYYDNEGKLTQISDLLIPGEATLVIKENARVILKPYADLIKRTYSPLSDLPVFYKNVNGKDLYFLSARLLENRENTVPSFNMTKSFRNGSFFKNPTIKNNAKTEVANPNPFDPKFVTAYSYFGTSWPRDYIYFGLTPTNTSGFFNNQYTESIQELWFTSPSIYSQISSESTDPKIIQVKSSSSNPSWTSGSYLMTFTIFVNAKNGIGLSIKKVIAVNPNDIWNVTYKKVFFSFWEFQSLTTKTDPINLDILPFDISNYSLSWKISVEDTRPGETQTTTNSYTSTFSENFSLDFGTGLLKKIGLKLGSSATQATTQTHTIATTYTSVELGDIVISFQDPILLTGGPLGPFFDYSTGSVGALIIPQAQW